MNERTTRRQLNPGYFPLHKKRSHKGEVRNQSILPKKAKHYGEGKIYRLPTSWKAEKNSASRPGSSPRPCVCQVDALAISD